MEVSKKKFKSGVVGVFHSAEKEGAWEDHASFNVLSLNIQNSMHMFYFVYID